MTRLTRMPAAARLGATAVALALPSAAVAEDVSYSVDGAEFSGYFAAAEEPKGLVLIVHDWDGMTDYEKRRADMLAELGYDAFALDVYGAGNRPDTMEGRRAATQEAFADRERLLALVSGGLETARAMSDAGLPTTIMGYCFGGTVTLAAARSGAMDEIAGYASFHGNFPDGPDWPAETPPILIMHGGADDNPSMADVASFAAEAEAAELTYTIEVYSGAPHAFTVFDSERYRERADLESWQAFNSFLDQNLMN